MISQPARFSLLAGLILWAGCADSSVGPAGPGAGHGHTHEPPHGGTAVVLGPEEYHIEFVLDADQGKMLAYILDGHMEDFVRIEAKQFEVEARAAGAVELLTFHAQARRETGETAGDTSQFEARADWLRGAKTFDALLKEISIRGKQYRAVSFDFPKGNEPANALHP